MSDGAPKGVSRFTPVAGPPARAYHPRIIQPVAFTAMPATFAFRMFAVAVGLLTFANIAIAAPMQPGLWEMAVTVTHDGTVGTPPPARACVTQADVDHPTKTFPRPSGACSLTNVQRTADRATYDLVCRENGITTRGRADIALGGERYDGKVEMMISGLQGTGVPLNMTISAKRVGDCAR